MAIQLRPRSVGTAKAPPEFLVTSQYDTPAPRAVIQAQPHVDQSRDGECAKTRVLVYTCSVRQRAERANAETQ